MAAIDSRIREKWKKRGKRRGKGKRRERWGVLALGRAGGGEGEARASPAGPIYRSASRCPGGEIFLVAVLIQHAGAPLTSSSHIAMAGTCPCACRSALVATLVARRGGDHGVDIDEFIVREVYGYNPGYPWQTTWAAPPRTAQPSR